MPNSHYPMFCAPADKTAAEDALTRALGGDQTDTFTVRASANGEEPATLLAAYAQLTPAEIDAIRADEDGGLIDLDDFTRALAVRGVTRIPDPEG